MEIRCTFVKARSQTHGNRKGVSGCHVATGQYQLRQRPLGINSLELSPRAPQEIRLPARFCPRRPRHPHSVRSL